MKDFTKFDTPTVTQTEKVGAIPLSTTIDVDKQETNSSVPRGTDGGNPEWVEAKTRGRWAKFWNAKTRTYNPPSSPARKKARRQKYAFKHLTTPGDPAYVPLHLCLTGDELLAELPRMRGDGTSFRYPRTDEARELVALLPHGKLRTVECLLLLAIAYAMLERRRHGLVATLAELGYFVGLKDTATSEAIARLIALGFVDSRATYTRFGACESQRGNLLRLTTQACAAFNLRDVPDGVALPTGTVDRARLERRRQPCGGIAHASATPRNPDANQDALPTREKTPDSFRNGARPAGAAGVVEAASPRSENFLVAGRTAPAVGPVARQGESCSTSGRARTEAVSRSALTADELAELVTDPQLRAWTLAAGPNIDSGQPPAIDDTAIRFSMLELDPKKPGGAS
jgi:hypothetical protein